MKGSDGQISRRALLQASTAFALAPAVRFSTSAGSEQEILERIAREEFPKLHSPGLWCAIAIRGKVVASIATGVRRHSTRDAAQLDDSLVWGSISKAVSATTVGALYRAGFVKYETRLRDVFPELSREYSSSLLDATVADFIVHHSGLANQLGWNIPDPGDEQKYRLAFMKDGLSRKPLFAPGAGNSYAPGVEFVAAMAERLVGQDWSKIQRKYLWDPSELKSVHMGWPASGVYGHIPDGEGWKESLAAHYSAKYVASGGVMGSISDLARFGSIHAEARVHGISTISVATFKKLHSHVERITNENSTARGATTLSGLNGWPDGNLMHDGMWYRGDYAQLWCSPRRRVSVALYRNSHRTAGQADFGRLLERLEEAIPILDYRYNGPGTVDS